uniref:Histone-lysine N-methyltransferase SUVR5 n=1 Tax=Kalanchoe fedtschenkoi TaxID=63787 RepID=A0A7N0T9G4_KALFE
MEVLPCPKQYVGESEQSPGTDFMYKEKANCIEPETDVQRHDHKEDEVMVEAQGPLRKEQGKDLGVNDKSAPVSPNGASLLGGQLEVQNSFVGVHEIQNGDIVKETHTESYVSPITSSSVDCEAPSNNNDEDLVVDSEWLDQDETLAVWVKCEGKWQAGIRCAKADWPLSALKARPIDKRKKHFLIFLPHTKNYSWADVSSIRPIDELPQPIAHGTHDAGREEVNDVAISHVFIMQKLAVGMLNIIDRMHPKALIETADDLILLKEFAMEVSRCSDFPHLGAMLVKLHNMISRSFMSSGWLENSSRSWRQLCQSADSAESVELLTEELSNSISWEEVKSLSNETVQSHFSSDWTSWKREVFKLFPMYNPLINSEDHEQPCLDESWNLNVQVSRKRPKLEIRRGELTASHSGTQSAPEAMSVDSGFLGGQDNLPSVTLTSEPSKEESLKEGNDSEDFQAVANKWVAIVVQADSAAELTPTKEDVSTPMNEALRGKSPTSKIKNRQCAAFIEAKGRQCVRFANEGDIYCCIHLASRFVSDSVKPKPVRSIDNPMCGGTTTLGSRCKHRSLNGSAFCKKHGPHSDMGTNVTAPDNCLKRKREDNVSSAVTNTCTDMVLAGKVGRPPLAQPVSVKDVDISSGLQSTSLHCVGSCLQDGSDQCAEPPKRHSLYCDAHLPNWLKRARNGKSRVISKDVYVEILRSCSSLEQKKDLHRACDLFYRFFKSVLSVRNPVPKDVQLQWALTEASKDSYVRGFLMRLISSEKERLQRHWGFSAGENLLIYPLGARPIVESQTMMSSATRVHHATREIIKCKICSAEFFDDQTLGAHWMENHKKESQWLFRGYGCAVCLDSFTNKKILESHIQEKHHVQTVEQYMLLQCILCDSHFGNSKDLWLHVVSCHPAHLKLSEVAQLDVAPAEKEPPKLPELDILTFGKKSSDNQGSARKFICRFCGMKFNLLPDLGRHHQAAHMGQNVASSHAPKAGLHYYALKLKAGRLKHPRFKKSLSAFQIRNRATAKMKHRIQTSKLPSTEKTDVQPDVQQVAHLGRLGEPKCSNVAKSLFSEVQKSKPRPNNQEILSVARSTCCKANLQSFLEARYGVLPKSLCFKAAKLCSEHNIEIKWHQEGFVCPNGCKPAEAPISTTSLETPRSNQLVVDDPIKQPIVFESNDCERDECHYIIGPSYFGQRPSKKVVCCDISFGQESVPVACVVDRDAMDSFCILPNGSYSQKSGGLMPWESFTYVTKPIHGPSADHDPKSSQSRCDGQQLTCSSTTCDQVYLFNTDYEDARDIYGKTIHGRFAYDDQRCIVLEEGYLVYECNHMCSCGKTCPNRVLQNGVQVKLEVFKTKEKGWAVRAGQPIRRGTFICEYVGEVLNEREATKRLSSYDVEGCSYMYKIDPQANDIGRINGGQESFVIDATKYGNVSRFVNHSLSPNLMNHQVLVEDMDCQLAHIGFYAGRDIRMGEDLTYDFRYGSLMGEGCGCRASMCRGRCIH